MVMLPPCEESKVESWESNPLCRAFVPLESSVAMTAFFHCTSSDFYYSANTVIKKKTFAQTVSIFVIFCGAERINWQEEVLHFGEDF